jgi:hypothetical protein
MAHKYWLMMLIAISPTISAAQDPIRLQGISDVYFQWRQMPKGSAMCGYALFGNHTSREDPKIEWDMNVDEIVKGNERVAALSAGTFTVNGNCSDAGHDVSRSPTQASVTEVALCDSGTLS